MQGRLQAELVTSLGRGQTCGAGGIHLCGRYAEVRLMKMPCSALQIVRFGPISNRGQAKENKWRERGIGWETEGGEIYNGREVGRVKMKKMGWERKGTREGIVCQLLRASTGRSRRSCWYVWQHDGHFTTYASSVLTDFENSLISRRYPNVSCAVVSFDWRLPPCEQKEIGACVR